MTTPSTLGADTADTSATPSQVRTLRPISKSTGRTAPRPLTRNAGPTSVTDVADTAAIRLGRGERRTQRQIRGAPDSSRGTQRQIRGAQGSFRGAHQIRRAGGSFQGAERHLRRRLSGHRFSKQQWFRRQPRRVSALCATAPTRLSPIPFRSWSA